MFNTITNYTCKGLGCDFTTDMNKEHLLHHIKQKIPTKINQTQINILPNRNDFLDDTLKNIISKQVADNKPLIFLPNTFYEQTKFTNDRSVDHIYLFGVLPCGSKTCVILTNVVVNVDIMVPDNISESAYESLLREELRDNDFRFKTIETVYLYKLHGFQTSPRAYKRIHFNSLHSRKKVIEYFKNKQVSDPSIEIASDDFGSNKYFAKVAREYRFNTANWNRFDKYEVVNNAKFTTNCTYVFKVNIANFKKLTVDDYHRIKSQSIMKKIIDTDPTLLCIWDMETCRSNKSAGVPTVKDYDFVIYMICTAFSLYYSNDQILEVCVVHGNVNTHKNIRLAIECATPRDVIIAHMEVIAHMAPDIMGTYNGAAFDWPLYREVARREKLLIMLKTKLSSIPLVTDGFYTDTEENIYKYSFKTEKIKIDAETSHVSICVANFAGILDIDVLPIFLKLYPRNEVRKAASLNYFLIANGLETKEDLAYKKMFRIYERSRKLVEITSCHCNKTDNCQTCCEKIKDLDFIPLDAAKSDSLYSNKLYDDLLCNNKEKCCYCGKKPRNLSDMTDIGYYCVIDCIRPHQLLVKRLIVNEKREISSLSYVSLYDSFYRADGMKVCNLIGAYCNKRDVAFSNTKVNKEDNDKDHYPGAYVFNPIRGLHSDRPIDITTTGPDGDLVSTTVLARPNTGVDFMSLYPSLMMAFNISADTVVLTREHADQLIAAGYDLYPLTPFPYEKGAKKGDKTNIHMVGSGWFVKHNGIVNPKKDKRIIIRYDKYITYQIVKDNIDQTVKIDAADEQRFINENHTIVSRKTTYEPVFGREALPGERMGIFSYILKKLFAKRRPIKMEQVRLKEILEIMENKKVKQYTFEINGVKTTYDVDELNFTIMKIEAKQMAIKLLSNTFYGKSGDYRSFIYSLLVAAGVTCAGQASIKKVGNFVRQKGYIINYGDTDSLYLSCPSSYYRSCDQIYHDQLAVLHQKFKDVPNVPDPDIGQHGEQAIIYKRERTELRIKWWTEQVRITMIEIDRLKEQITDYLCGENNSLYLNMDYEEVGYPSILCGKKKYCMIPHIKEINFYPKKYFIKGIDIVKQGQAVICKQLGNEFIADALSPENERELIDIAVDKLRKFYTIKTDVSSYVRSARYKSNKKNVAVQTFVKRMREIYQSNLNDPALAIYEPPEDGDKFDYVIVKKSQTYTIKGNMINLTKGDKMEYVRVYNASQNTTNPMEIDKDNYLRKSVIGVLARFIVYHPSFQPPIDSFKDSDDSYSELDKYCQQKAIKYLNGICNTISGDDRSLIRQTGKIYRSIYNNKIKLIYDDLSNKNNNIKILVKKIKYDKDICSQIMDLGANIKINDNSAVVNRIIDKNIKLPALRSLYITNNNSISKTRLVIYNTKINEFKDRLAEVIPTFTNILSEYSKRINVSITNITNDSSATEYINTINTFTDHEIEIFDKIISMIDQIKILNSVKNNTLNMIKNIEDKHIKSIN